MVQLCSMYMWNIAKVKNFPCQPNFQVIIHAFIMSRLDYFNSLCSGLNQKAISRLHLIQNSAAKLLTN